MSDHSVETDKEKIEPVIPTIRWEVIPFHFCFGRLTAISSEGEEVQEGSSFRSDWLSLYAAGFGGNSLQFPNLRKVLAE